LQYLEITNEETIRHIAFNRPNALNAFTPDLLREFVTAVRAAEKDDTVNVVVLYGKGRAFSAGVDLKLLNGIAPKEGKVGDVFDNTTFEAAEVIRQSAIPIIAKVHGFCFTGALEIALHCDFIYTSATTKFGDTHAKWGLRPTWGMSQNLARAIGVRRARELSLTARTFTGVEAAKWGIAIEAAATDKDLDLLVAKRAKQIAEGSTGAISAYKKLYQLHEENRELEDALAEEVRLDFPEITDTAERLARFTS